MSMRMLRGIGLAVIALVTLGCASDSGVQEIDGRKVRCLNACKEWERDCSTGAVVTESGGASSVTRCRPICKRYGRECYDVEE